LKFFASSAAIARVFDIIGDIHGHFDALEELLHRLGYRSTGGSRRYPRRARRVLFLGDYIDRGPFVLETVDLVRRMVEADDAVAILGNHEYNAILWHTIGADGEPLRTHSTAHRLQHEATLRSYAKNRSNGALQDAIDWFRTLPFSFETDRLRAVHATWDPRVLEQLATLSRNRSAPLMDDAFLCRSAIPGTVEFIAVETLLKGVEITLPDHTGYRDKDGVFRRTTRIRWWIDPDSLTGRVSQRMLPLSDVAMPPADTLLKDLYVDPHSLPIRGDSDPRPVFIGHYWLTGPPAPLSPTVVCLDYSVAQGGSLCAYRWEEDQIIAADRFVCVSAAPS
jgi:hypothetical protein